MPCYYRLLGVLVLACLISTTASSQEQPPEQLPSGRLAFTGFSLGLLVGYQQGQGALEFQGRKYPFSIESYGLFTLGGSQVDALGVVYDLDKLEDFEGRYGAATFGVTAWQGGNVTVMTNQNGVVIYLQSLRQGLELSLGGSFDIVLERTPLESETNTAAAGKPTSAPPRPAQAEALPPPELIGKSIGDRP
ncbi:MAG: hypothetical protein U1F76_13975 [Candidatus Competibacteraceae bacterium]